MATVLLSNANSVGRGGVYHMEVDPYVTNGPGCVGGITATGTQHATTVFDVKMDDGGRLVVDDTVVSAGRFDVDVPLATGQAFSHHSFLLETVPP